ncbi:hypothetical protein DSECCO2_398290 [anaerobic digester metagenome]
MPKNYNLKELILQLLSGGELSKKELMMEIRRESDNPVSDKTINESLMTLLKDEKIYIIGYDFDVYEGVKRIQSIRPEGVIFGRLKKDFVEIDNLIKQLESSDVEEVKESSYKLKRLFRKKLESITNEELSSLIEEDIDSLFNRTIYYINTQKEEQKRILKNKLAWSLSTGKGSDKLFEDIIKYTVSH